ncbi:MAG: T9SS type A sorting domain-containing protein [Candidatus Cloacimonetes bacterium]|nr:T9SS type A sorting domain-containing protein [Candidatus Cloacimonadota bacterium]
MKGVILLLFMTSIMSAAVINIPGDYALIQAGIEVSVDGDTVLVEPGTYVENIDFYGKNITVSSLYITTQDTIFISQTIIDGNQNGSVVSFTGNEDSTAVLSGFTLINGSGTFIIEYPNGDRYYNGGGIYCLNASPRLEYLTISGCSCSYRGGAIYLESSSSKLCHLNLDLNTAGNGGGIFFDQADNGEITDSRITNNSAEEMGGGIYSNSGYNCNISRVIVSNNSSDGYCGGIFLGNTECIIEDSEIRNNNGYVTGGIEIWEGNVTLQNSIVTGNSGYYGGGIHMILSNTILNNVEISHNTANQGGGIYCEIMNEADLNNVLIHDNSANIGGGICCYNYLATYLNNTTVRNNRANVDGGGIYCEELCFNENEPSNIYMNHAGFKGMDVCFFGEIENTILYVDTFTVAEPDEYFIYSENLIPYDIQHSIIEQVAADLYVSPAGSNANSGLSADAPLGSITYALAKITATEEQPQTIFLEQGIYSSANTGEIFPENMRSNINISGASQHNVAIDADGNNRVIAFINDENCSLSDLSLINGDSEFPGGALFAQNAQLKLEKVTVSGSHSGLDGGGIYCCISEIELDKVLINNNSADNYGGAIFCRGSDINIVNTTVIVNAAGFGGAIYSSENSDIVLVNCLLWENQPYEIVLGNYYEPCNIVIANSDVQGGEEEIVTNNGNLQWMDNNLNEDPLMIYPPGSFFTLQVASPCIDTGTSYFYWNGEVYIDLDEDEYNGEAPDMGYAEYYVEGNDECKIENVKYKINNYPNPFNPATRIEFELKESAEIELTVYDLRGQLVKRLLQGEMSAGRHVVDWDGLSGHSRQSVGSGIYFVRLTTRGRFLAAKKMLLLK